MSKIFISYSRSDKSLVDELIGQLEAAGHPVWVDREGIRGGEQWRQEIVEAIEQNDVFLLLLSNNSIQSDHVRTEVDLAKESTKRIIPVEIQPVVIPSTLKYQMAGLQRIKLYSDYEEGFQELLSALSVGKETATKVGVPKVEAKGRSQAASSKKGIVITGIVVLVVLVLTLAYSFLNNSNSTADNSHPTPSTASEHASLDQLTTVDQIEPLLLKANIHLSAPQDEARTRSYFTGPDSAYHMLAVAALTVVGQHRFSQPVFLDMVDEYYTQMAGSNYADNGSLDLEKVNEALIDAHNDYYGDDAALLDALFEGAQVAQPAEPLVTQAPQLAATLAPVSEAQVTELPAPVVASPPGGEVNLQALTTLDELEPLLKQANIRLSEPEDEARTRSYFTGPDSAYHMLAVASLTVLDGRRFIQPVNLDIVDKWYTQAVGSGYAERGSLDLELVTEALVDAHNDYWGDNASTLDELVEPVN